MSKKNVLLEKVAKGVKFVAAHTDEKKSFTAFGFYQPKKPVK